MDRRVRRDVTAVGEGVHPRAVFEPGTLPQLEQRSQVVDMRVDAAGRDEPEEVHVAVPLLRAPESAEERLVLEQRAVLDGAAHANEVLEQDPPRSDRQVADLRVPHLPLRKAHRRARRAQLRGRIASDESVEDGCPRKLDSVAGAGRSDPPSVEDHQRDERQPVAAHGPAARQIAANEAGSSEGMPTSVLLMVGWVIAAAALAVLTELL